MIQVETYPQIQYLPICTECGKIITEEVKFINHRVINPCGNIYTDWEIKPGACPECGAKFTGITVHHPIIEPPKDGE